MSAIIKCSNAIKEEIKSYCLSEIGALMQSIREGADAVTAKVHDDGLEIAFPIGEIYGYTSDYVQALPNVFKELKKKHPDIAVRGIAYEYETVSEATFGPYFYCAAEDKDLTVTFEWQECAVCGNIIETDACYNSSQHDFGEGNLLCLCSPTCMLEYALSKEHGEVQLNGSFDEEEADTIYDSDDEDKALKKMLWKRITLNQNDYQEDFKANKERITALIGKKGTTEAKKKVLVSLIEETPSEAPKKAPTQQKKANGSTKEVESIDFPSSSFVLIGLDYEQGETIRKGLEQRKGTIKDRMSAKVQYVIIPDKKFTKNSNYKKAEELIQKGNDIHIIKLSKYKELLRKYDEALYGVDGADAMGNFVVTLYDDHACLEEYIGMDLAVVIPNKIGTLPVTQLGDRCFCQSKITSIVIPDTITEIPTEAFSYCSELASVDIPRSVTVIGSNAFEFCKKLKKVSFAPGLLEIKEYAFKKCAALSDAVLPDTVSTLECGAFGDCKKLGEVYISAGVTSIDSPFYGCDKLTKIIVDPNNPIYDSRDNCNAIIETATNKLVMGCKETVIPASVSIIGNSAFASFDAITSFVVPEGITEIEEGAFSYCFNLKSITLPESLEKLGNSAFYFCRSLKKIKIPSNVKEFHICVFSNCLSLSELVIHDNLIAIGGIDSLWSYRCDIRKVLGSPKSIAKSLAEQCRWEYVETK